MNREFAAAMRRATLSTRAQDPVEATRIIQDALAGRTRGPSERHNAEQPLGSGLVIDHDPAPGQASGNRASDRPERARRPLRDVLKMLREGHARADGDGGRYGLPGMPAPDPAMPEGAQFLVRSYQGAAGGRRYRLYVPASVKGPAAGMVVMLHGCKQTPEDFAFGTGMNAVAEEHGLIVVYPEQTGGHNAASCWNWFDPAHQSRDKGEPAILAGIARSVASTYRIQPGRIFAAGLSAGGAMAAVLAETYPDLFAAIGVHSGLGHGAASDVVSAFAAMRGDDQMRAKPARRSDGAGKARVIIFHGSADRTVHPSNGERIAAAAASAGGRDTENGVAGGRAYRRESVRNDAGLSLLEHWVVEGAGHAWSGGRQGGSYVDTKGPDASREMVRFFLETSDSARPPEPVTGRI